MKTSVLRYAAIGMATLSMAGFAAASTVSVGTTGPDSSNHVYLNNAQNLKFHNNNNVGVANESLQGAGSGNVDAAKNTSVSGGGLSSGDARNSNDTRTTVTVNNTGAASALSHLAGMAAPDDHVSLNLTGPDSDNKVSISNTQKVSVTNNNNVEVVNENLQWAKSGNVSAYKNTTVGGLSSGDATNTNATTTSVNVSN